MLLDQDLVVEDDFDLVETLQDVVALLLPEGPVLDEAVTVF